MRRYILVMTAFLRPVLILLVALLPLTGCGEVPARKPDARILMMGDSMLAWNGGTGQAVSDAIEDTLNEPVVDQSGRAHGLTPVAGNKHVTRLMPETTTE